MWRQRLQRDHIIPSWNGGTDEADNIQLLCANCHEDKTIEEMKGYRFTDEIRAKISAGVIANKKGYYQTPAGKVARKKISETRKKNWQAKYTQEQRSEFARKREAKKRAERLGHRDTELLWQKG